MLPRQHISMSGGAGGGGLTSVAHDGTLAGDGTVANPLSVVGGPAGDGLNLYFGDAPPLDKDAGIFVRTPAPALAKIGPDLIIAPPVRVGGAAQTVGTLSGRLVPKLGRHDGDILIAGGATKSAVGNAASTHLLDVYRMDPATYEISPLGSVLPFGTAGGAGAIIDGIMVSFGSCTWIPRGGIPTKDVFRFDLVNNLSLSVPSLPVELGGSAYADDGTDILFFTGGMSNTGIRKTSCMYRFSENELVTVADLPDEFSDATMWGGCCWCAATQEFFLAGGGYFNAYSALTNGSNVVAAYKPSTNAWRIVGALPYTDWYGGTLTCVGNTLVLAGGYVGNAPVNTLYLFDVVSETFTLNPTNFPVAIGFSSSIAIDGRIFIFNGTPGNWYPMASNIYELGMVQPTSAHPEGTVLIRTNTGHNALAGVYADATAKITVNVRDVYRTDASGIDQPQAAQVANGGAWRAV